MAPEKAEVEVKLGVPVERMWSAATKIEVLMPQVLPDVFTSCDLDGDGGPGSIRVYHCGPGTLGFVFLDLVVRGLVVEEIRTIYSLIWDVVCSQVLISSSGNRVSFSSTWVAKSLLCRARLRSIMGLCDDLYEIFMCIEWVSSSRRFRVF